ncbi:uncharacterized protein LOC122650469 [Telopea speciosissima]|uniref:uncharacterized protein LOC122650469 n=1 Tax=Telopea speciosissima TaxID=54955 RepID=UPI001CC3B1AE|nr:uncharacterized protein LOC122650469 [Telopea speciosissima]
MRMVLFAKNKMMFVDDTLSRPDSPPTAVATWDRCNFMVLSWLLIVLTRTTADSVIYAETTYSVWKDLKELFSHSNVPRIFHLKRSVATIQQGTDSLSTYFTRLKVLWDELASYVVVPTCSCSAQHALHSSVQQERVYQFLMGLSDSYASVC